MTPPPETSALDRLRSPEGLGRPPAADLARLAAELRAETIGAASNTGRVRPSEQSPS